MFGWLKKKGIDFACSYIKEKATVDNLSSATVDIVDTLIGKVIAGEGSQKKLGKTCTTLREVCDVLGLIATALEDGKITADEAQTVTQRIYRAFNGSPLTDAVIGGYIDAIAEEIKSKV